MSQQGAAIRDEQVVHLDFDLASVGVLVDLDIVTDTICSLSGSSQEEECDYLVVLTFVQWGETQMHPTYVL